MTFIDWSDPEGLLDLLVEFVSDEEHDSHADVKRQRFLADLLSQLNRIKERFDGACVAQAIADLRNVHESVAPEFLQDPVMPHISACIEELENNSGAA